MLDRAVGLRGPRCRRPAVGPRPRPPGPGNPLRLLPNRKSSAYRDLSRKSGCDADGRRQHGRIIKGMGQFFTLTPFIDRTEAGTMDDRRRSTTDFAPPRSLPVYTMYGCSENAPDPATLCHFSGPPARPRGGATGPASRCGVTGSGLRDGRPGRPEARWHRCTENCQRVGGLLYTMGRGSRAPAASPKWQAPTAPGECPAGRCQTGTLLPPIVLLEPCRTPRDFSLSALPDIDVPPANLRNEGP
jgi:hypothetical protein